MQCLISLQDFVIVVVVLGNKPGALHILGKWSTNELHIQPHLQGF
jgi:hypothetical protein